MFQFLEKLFCNQVTNEADSAAVWDEYVEPSKITVISKRKYHAHAAGFVPQLPPTYTRWSCGFCCRIDLHSDMFAVFCIKDVGFCA